MIDVNLLLRTWLLAPTVQGLSNPVTPLLGATPLIFAGHLPQQGANPALAPIIVVRVGGGTASVTGGGSAEAEMPIVTPRMQITVWAGTDQYDVARNVYCAIFDWLHGKNNVDLTPAGYVLSMLEMSDGQDVSDPHTGLATTVSFWAMRSRVN